MRILSKNIQVLATAPAHTSTQGQRGTDAAQTKKATRLGKTRRGCVHAKRRQETFAFRVPQKNLYGESCASTSGVFFLRSRRIWELASGVDDGPAGASLLVCIAMGPRTSCLKSKLAWTSYRREAAVATLARTSSCPRRGRGVRVRIVAWRRWTARGPAGRRRCRRRGRSSS